MIERFRTARLRGRRLVEQDGAALLALRRDPAVAAWLGAPPPADQLNERLAALQDHWRRHDYGLWILHKRADGAFAGYVGLQQATIEGVAEIELLYALCPACWGRGLASEAARHVVRLAFGHLGLASLIAYTLPANHASRRVMAQAGFRYERDIVHAGRPHVLYRHVRTASG
jgi:[ribosomal protein S5]-alanine N-acetyltransferase